MFKQRWEEIIIDINDCSSTVAVYIGDFNARNSEWWNDDPINLQGTELAQLAAQYNSNQVIDGPTHILHNSAPCIDLISIAETNFITNSGVLPLLFPWCHYQIIIAKVSFTIKEVKSNYFSYLGEYLNDPAITLKKYCSTLYIFVHKRKITKIPPICHNNAFLTDTLVKVNTFKSFFAKQCSLIETGSELSIDYQLTHHRIESLNLDLAKIISIISAFDVSKAHGWHNVSVSMVKICHECLIKPLFNIS